MAGKDVRVVEVADRTVEISNPDKVYFPELGATKFDLVSYYLDVADALGVTAAGRPALLAAVPRRGRGQVLLPEAGARPAPRAGCETTVVTTPNGTTSNALVVADIAHVLWAVNLGCLGLHLWPYRADDPDHADELRIDLDPQPGTTFDEVRAAAEHVRTLLDELGMVGYPKTTGNRGIHVYVRLEPRWDSFEVRAGAVALARELERRHPDLITANWWKEERGERVFVDFNQNAPHKTVFGAWFARPAGRRPGVDPAGLGRGRHGRSGGADHPDRPRAACAGRGDPWAGIADRPQSLQPLLDMAARDRADGLHDAPWPPEYPKQPDEPTRVAPEPGQEGVERVEPVDRPAPHRLSARAGRGRDLQGAGLPQRRRRHRRAARRGAGRR